MYARQTRQYAQKRDTTRSKTFARGAKIRKKEKKRKILLDCRIARGKKGPKILKRLKINAKHAETCRFARFASFELSNSKIKKKRDQKNSNFLSNSKQFRQLFDKMAAEIVLLVERSQGRRPKCAHCICLVESAKMREEN